MVEHLPPLTILVINQHGRPGSGFIALNPDRFEEGLNEVYSQRWNELPNPFVFASDGTQYKDLLNDLLSESEASEDVYARVKVRGVAQLIFRDLLMKVYSKKCCFSGLGLVEGLEAVHIVPWASCERKDRLNIRNGLLLSSLHHRFFDAGVLSIAPDYRITFCPSKNQPKQFSAFDSTVTKQLHLKPMRLPRRPEHYPSPDLIMIHNRLLQLENNLP